MGRTQKNKAHIAGLLLARMLHRHMQHRSITVSSPTALHTKECRPIREEIRHLACHTFRPMLVDQFPLQATEYHLGQLKAKLAKLRTELQAPAAGGKGGGEGFEVQKYGDSRVALIGGV